MAFSLGDDGTLDTVIVCDDCGEEIRFNFDGDGSLEYQEWIAECIEECERDHECEESE